MKKTSSLGLAGTLRAHLVGENLRRDARITGCDVEWLTDDSCRITHHNAFVNQGLENALDLIFSLGGTAISHVGLSNNDTAVTASTTTIGSPNSIKAISVGPTRTNQTVAAGANFTNSDVSFVINKIGLLNGSGATAVQDIVGGSGGSSPYDESFSIDLTSVASWDLDFSIEVSLSAA